jgi:excisionase family DNA binding protein
MATAQPTSPEFLTVRELAAYLRVSVRTAYQLVYDGAVPAARVGGQYRIPRAQLDERLAQTMREPGSLSGLKGSRAGNGDSS